MSSWRAPTLKDRESMVRNDVVRAPCCGRKTSADMLLDVSGHPAHMRAKGSNYICDACRERLFLERKCTREEFYAVYQPPLSFMIALAAFAFNHGPVNDD